MKLNDLLKILAEYQAESHGGVPEVEVKFLTQDARLVSPGSVYVAISGTKHDGHQFLQNACDQGAVAIVVEKAETVPKGYAGFVQVVQDSREALQRLASQYYSDPSRYLMTFGVTGTNGKTSVTYMLEAVLSECGYPCGVMGTINHHLRDHVWTSETTTPDPVSLQRRLFEMRSLGAKAVAMEVSSHALVQKRADSVFFDTVIFTNLTQDHLDYHANMKDYFLAKQRLFTDLLWNTLKFPSFAVINTDDVWGAKMRVAGHAGILTYGQNNQADFRFSIQKMDFSGTEYSISTSSESFQGKIKLVGKHNVANITAVIAACATVGILPVTSMRILANFAGVPGRLEAVENSKGFNVLVDYAHSPDALENVLSALLNIKKEAGGSAKIWTIFGCGGDRDKTKRPQMGAIALRLSDYVMVTSDNPRSESADSIIQDILVGFGDQKSSSKVFVQSDRRKAIEIVLKNLQIGDVVLIAGKGHEDYQIIGNDKLPFSDVQVVKDILQ